MSDWREASWLGKAWAFPITAVGLLLALLTGSKRIGGDVGGLRYYEAGGLAHWWLKTVRASAYTLGACAFFVESRYITSPSSARLRRHEARHYWQWRCFGVLMVPLYLVGVAWGAIRGNWKRLNPFEVDAYVREKD